MKAVVIDTNVLIVANKESSQAGPDDVIACVDALEKVQRKRLVSIDSNGMIFNEYFRHVSRSGQPGMGDAFAKWLSENQSNPERCEQVLITPKDNDPEDFQEFPDDRDLTGFDRSDRKFVAVAIASRYSPKVLNATDSDWWIYRKPLKKHGVNIIFLCPVLLKRGKHKM